MNYFEFQNCITGIKEKLEYATEKLKSTQCFVQEEIKPIVDKINKDIENLRKLLK